MLLGYALYAGGIWKGDIFVAAVEELETMDALEIYAKRLNAKEVITPKSGEYFIFPIPGTVKLSGRDHGIRTSTSMRDQPENSEELSADLRGSSDKSQTRDETTDVGEARNDFGSIEGNYICRHQVEPRVQHNRVAGQL